MFSKTMEFCNKGVVPADPPPPQLWSYFDHFFLGPFPKTPLLLICFLRISFEFLIGITMSMEEQEQERQ